MDLILIHGRDQQGKDPAELQRLWESTWDEGLLAADLQRPGNVRVVMPFYGDELMSIMKRIDDKDQGLLEERGPHSSDAELAFRQELLTELAIQEGVTDEEIRNELAPGIRDLNEKGPLQWAWVQALLRVLDKTSLGENSLDKFTHDAFVYLKFPAARQIVDDIVSAALPKTGPCVVVGHSLGSVVGFNVLRNAVAPCQVERFITIGSPLGLHAIKNRLKPPLKMPAVVREWCNAFDEKDVVALRPLSDTVFPVTPPILNHSKVRNTRNSNHHGITGYLNDPVVARWMHERL